MSGDKVDDNISKLFQDEIKRFHDFFLEKQSDPKAPKSAQALDEAFQKLDAKLTEIKQQSGAQNLTVDEYMKVFQQVTDKDDPLHFFSTHLDIRRFIVDLIEQSKTLQTPDKLTGPAIIKSDPHELVLDMMLKMAEQGVQKPDNPEYPDTQKALQAFVAEYTQKRKQALTADQNNTATSTLQKPRNP